MTATTRAEARLIKADAADRAGRTFRANILTDGALILLYALAEVVFSAVSGWSSEELVSPAAWAALALLLGKTALVTAASYILRLQTTPKVQAEGLLVPGDADSPEL